MITLGNLSCNKGEKVQGFWDIEGYQIPVTIINGVLEGKTVGISAGVHACEYIGIQTALELASSINPKDVAGTIIILHTVNYSGFFAKSPAVMPEDNQNLNRMFPGNIDGTLSEKVAYYFSNTLYPMLDFFLDLHGGDAFENVTSFIYAPGIGDESVINFAHEVASVIDVPFRVRSKSSTGAYNSANIQGVPALLIETGGKGYFDKDLVPQYKNYITTALKYLEVLNDDTPLVKNTTQKVVTNAKYIDSPVDGYWYPSFKAGDSIEKGDLIGQVKDCFGNTLIEYFAEFSGIVLYQTVSLATYNGNSLIAYGEM